MRMKYWWIVGIVVALGSLAHAQTTQPASTSSTTTAAVPTTSSPTAEQVRNQLLAPSATEARQLPPATVGAMADVSTGRGAVAPAAPTLNVMREGTFIVNRVGRLKRSADGQQAEFAFESDGKTMRDPPMVILPNLKLMQMENAVTGSSRDLKFRVSGVVTEYKGRNYVLLDKVVVVPDIDQQF
jgi:guanyl-specific ribonuclease Sa